MYRYNTVKLPFRRDITVPQTNGERVMSDQLRVEPYSSIDIVDYVTPLHTFHAMHMNVFTLILILYTVEWKKYLMEIP